MSFPGFPSPPSPGSPPSPSNHNLLSSTHGDTTSATPLTGDMIISATGNIWERLPVGSELEHLVIVAGIPTWTMQAGSGLGNVTGPGESTDNAIARFSGPSGMVIQDSLVIIDDMGNMSVAGNTLISGDLTVLGDIIGLDLSASGFVVGPASATDSAVALYDGATGELIKDSSLTSNGTSILIPGDVSASGNLHLPATLGDILYATTLDTFGILGVGADDEVLTLVGGIPAWAASAGGGGGGSGTFTGDLTVGGDVLISGDLTVLGLTIQTISSGTAVSYTIGDTYYNAITSATTGILLPPSPVGGQQHVIKDIDGTAGTTAIIVDGNGNTIDGLSSTSLVNNYEATTLIFGPTEWNII